uniref:Uncharacterized protein n=1 Tax=Desulfovibrio desulfuricans (strain ATCC 27774 / DSM 6949 / MB) TaxID=525146 RepID=B8J4M5_DESDA
MIRLNFVLPSGQIRTPQADARPKASCVRVRTGKWGGLFYIGGTCIPKIQCAEGAGRESAYQPCVDFCKSPHHVTAKASRRAGVDHYSGRSCDLRPQSWLRAVTQGLERATHQSNYRFK